MPETWEEAMDQYDELLNEQGAIKIGNLTYSPAYVLKEVDPIAYWTGIQDWLDSEGIDSDDLAGELTV